MKWKGLNYYVESPTRSGERPTFTSLHNARPHTYLSRGWRRSNPAQKLCYEVLLPPKLVAFATTAHHGDKVTTAAAVASLLARPGHPSLAHGRHK